MALELTPTADFTPLSLARRTRLFDLWSEIAGLRRALLQIPSFTCEASASEPGPKGRSSGARSG